MNNTNGNSKKRQSALQLLSTVEKEKQALVIPPPSPKKSLPKKLIKPLIESEDSSSDESDFDLSFDFKSISMESLTYIPRYLDP